MAQELQEICSENLRRTLNPQSIAIIGASPRDGAFGQRVLGNLADFVGRIYPVNSRYETISDRKCYAGLTDLPEVPDCVVIVVGRNSVLKIVEECAAHGVGGVIIFASGFSETAKSEDVELQKRLTDIAKTSYMRIVGPNCLGVINIGLGAAMTFQEAPRKIAPWPRGSIGVISQSGALGVALSQATQRGCALSHVLTSGNSCDVDITDYIKFLVDDENCGAIACTFEGVLDGSKLVAAALRAAEAKKPLIVYKMAASDGGAAAAMSHSGTFAGSHDACCAILRRAGAIVVDSIDAMLETAAFFCKAPLVPQGKGAAVLTTSGGASIIAADSAEKYSVSLPPPAPATYEVLAARVPDFGSVGNPCDVTAQVVNDPEMYAECARAMLEDEAFSVLVSPHVLAQEFACSRIAQLDELATQTDKIVCNVWISEWTDGPGARESQAAGHIAWFRTMDRCFATLEAWKSSADARACIGMPGKRFSSPSAKTAGANLLAGVNGVMTERASKALLSAYGIKVAQDHLVASVNEARIVASQLGGAVVLKGEVQGLAHKSEAGLVRLNLRQPDELAAGFTDIRAAINRLDKSGTGKIILQPMIPEGVEIMIGGRVDPQFGPMIVLGLGGVLVELVKDTVLEPSPVDRETALAMMSRLRCQGIFDGFRHLPAVDREALAEVICRFSELLSDQADFISEVDVNPLICNADGIIAVDGLVRVRASENGPSQ
ncbi:acetate--CoA ligase family protein [Sulfitobacter sp. KE34]|nr:MULTISPECIES: acetate--CoA ligase family protein [unclassified Sulfitobacter]MDF3355628.1 acetate--CoA ligase family protein [Sulfitobacter sp. KE27]MDF3359318.1 acetate--CoA ligase family protein [Sulfitobacter sp. KE33]MDF3442424.1 acetate--CoA ligase family protein [Sulfitobacter sp. KE34]MDF3351963.1 acetate--CoA ligase family protein [Sulfitobacter sp. KE12]MDF3370295.1 acetate--CoA ligase family protein [Sulfitobacter sp. Ks43]